MTGPEPSLCPGLPARAVGSPAYAQRARAPGGKPAPIHGSGAGFSAPEQRQLQACAPGGWIESTDCLQLSGYRGSEAASARLGEIAWIVVAHRPAPSASEASGGQWAVGQLQHPELGCTTHHVSSLCTRTSVPECQSARPAPAPPRSLCHLSDRAGAGRAQPQAMSAPGGAMAGSVRSVMASLVARRVARLVSIAGHGATASCSWPACA